MNKRLAKQILKQWLRFNNPPIHDAIIYSKTENNEVSQYTYNYLKQIAQL
jgi:hypothetical protein